MDMINLLQWSCLDFVNIVFESALSGYFSLHNHQKHMFLIEDSALMHHGHIC